MKEYKRLLAEFTGEKINSSGVISEERFASFLFGILVRKAYTVTGIHQEFKKDVHGYPYFVISKTTNNGVIKDIANSLSNNHWIRIYDLFTDKEKQTIALLLGWVGNCDEVAFLAGYTCHLTI